MAPVSTPATAPARPAHGMAFPDKFFAAVRPLFGTITKAQVEGIKAKLAALAALAAAASPIARRVRPGHFVLNNRREVAVGGGDRPRHRQAYGKPGKHRGQITYGRGDVQLS
jgi:hypothetical protein